MVVFENTPGLISPLSEIVPLTTFVLSLLKLSCMVLVPIIVPTTPVCKVAVPPVAAAYKLLNGTDRGELNCIDWELQNSPLS